MNIYSNDKGNNKELIERAMLKNLDYTGLSPRALSKVLTEKDTPSSIKVPAGAESIAQGAFVGAKDLNEVDFSNSNVKILSPIDRIKTLETQIDTSGGTPVAYSVVEPIPALILKGSIRPIRSSEIDESESTGIYSISTIRGEDPVLFSSQWFVYTDGQIMYEPFDADVLNYYGVLWQSLTTKPEDWEDNPNSYFEIKNNKPVRLNVETAPTWEKDKYYELIDTAHPSGVEVDDGLTPSGDNVVAITDKPDWWDTFNENGMLIYRVYELQGEKPQNVFHGVNADWTFPTIEFEADKYYECEWEVGE